MAASAMTCPMCGGETRSGAGGASYAARERANKRTRVCVINPEHRFATLERPSIPDLLARTQVTLDGRVQAYDRSRLMRDLDYAIGDVLNSRARRSVADRVEGLLQARLPPMTPRERSLPSGVVARLTSALVQETVAQALGAEATEFGASDLYRRNFRRAHVMWVLARGTAMGRFSDVAEVLAWMWQAYGREADRRGEGFVVERHYASVVTDMWHPLRADAAPEPRWIVFLIHKEVPPAPDGLAPRTRYEHERRPFDRQRLLTSVRHALAGRDDHSRVANMVVQWTLWSLGGQVVVRSADLASQVTQCLRRVDEIAYLRWCIKVKALDVNDVWDEALGMLSWPSPRLAFEPEAAQDPRRVDKAMPRPSASTVDTLRIQQHSE